MTGHTLQRHAGTTTPMHRSRPLLKRRRRGVVMIEFAMILPLFLFLMLFTVDMGRMVLLQAGLQDATQQSARAGAQVGGASISNRSRITFDSAIDAAPGLESGRVSRFTINSGGTCSAGQTNVTIDARYSASLITPGLTALLGVFAGQDGQDAGDWSLSATSVARCEVLRPG